jgi:hypothetical protein
MALSRFTLTSTVTITWPAVWSELVNGAAAVPVSTPAVPATTVAQGNPYGVPVAVAVTGATVTVIAVNGTATGLTPGAGTASVVVPYPGTISLTCASGSPAWAWTAAELPQSGSSSMTAAVGNAAPPGGQAAGPGGLHTATFQAGTAIYASSASTDGAAYALYQAIGAGNLTAFRDGTDAVGHACLVLQFGFVT